MFFLIAGNKFYDERHSKKCNRIRLARTRCAEFLIPFFHKQTLLSPQSRRIQPQGKLRHKVSCEGSHETARVQINSLIIGSVLLCCTVISLRFVGKEEVEIWKVPFRLNYFPFFALLLSVAHVYCAGLIELRVNDLLGSGDELRRCAWQKLTTEGPIIFQGCTLVLLLRRTNNHWLALSGSTSSIERIIRPRFR